MEFRHNLFNTFLSEFEKMMYDDYYPFRGMYQPYETTFGGTTFLPSQGDISNRLVSYKHPNLDVKEENDEVAVAIDLPGVDKDNIKIRLVDPRTLEISCEQGSEHEDKKENYYIKERTYGYMKRLISLPSDVTEIGMKSAFKNGVLDLKFKKSLITPKEYLKLE